LETFKPESFANAATAKVSPGWAKGKWIGADYVTQIANPNFYSTSPRPMRYCAMWAAM
jgi:hypothetical protein